MTKSFRSDDLNQSLLMPPSLHEWLPENHLARFVADLVETLDLSAFYRSYEAKDGRGQAAYSPVLMVRLLVYGYCTGVVSSRQIEKRTHEDVAFRYLSADTHPDHSTFNEFRKRHLEALAGLFLQALGLCRKAGLVKLGHVAVDAVEDEKQRHGVTDQLPKELARRESRLKKIRQARAELEAEARQKAGKAKADAEARMAQRRKQEERTGKKTGGGQPRVPDPKQAAPDAKAQRNFTDPDSRIMPDGAHKGSFVQAYNAQIAVDDDTQVIVAAEITQDANDKEQLAPMVAQVRRNTGTRPVAVSADAGYWSPRQVTDPRAAGIDLHVATGRVRTGASPKSSGGPPGATEGAGVREQMKQKLDSDVGRAVYKMRKAIVEPVFGQTRECRGFRRFSFRGLENVRAEWQLVCLTHNILKLFRYGGGFKPLAA